MLRYFWAKQLHALQEIKHFYRLCILFFKDGDMSLFPLFQLPLIPTCFVLIRSAVFPVDVDMTEPFKEDPSL